MRGRPDVQFSCACVLQSYMGKIVCQFCSTVQLADHAWLLLQ